MKAPAGSYLITGRPRSRTAWLAALMYQVVPCYHDEVHRLVGLIRAGMPFGFSSPSLVVQDPDFALAVFRDTPIVVVERESDESRDALARWAGRDMPNWHVVEGQFQRFMERVPQGTLLRVPVRALEEYETANRIHRHCLGTELCPERFRVFNLLKIEQHLEKAMANTPALRA